MPGAVPFRGFSPAGAGARGRCLSHTEVEQAMSAHLQSRSGLRRIVSVAAALFLVTVSAAACHSGGASGASGTSGTSGASFYQGKTLKFIVPYAPGGGYDQWPRVLEPYLKKYLGVASIQIMNVAGGGGLIGTSQVYHAKAD